MSDKLPADSKLRLSDERVTCEKPIYADHECVGTRPAGETNEGRS